MVGMVMLATEKWNKILHGNASVGRSISIKLVISTAHHSN
jgi:hypothetical protein